MEAGRLRAPVPTADGKFALDVTDYELDDVEEASTFETYLPLEVEDDT